MVVIVEPEESMWRQSLAYKERKYFPDQVIETNKK